MAEKTFPSETALVSRFVMMVEAHCAPERWKTNPGGRPEWTIYHETDGWDLILVDKKTGAQIGIEAKLALNPKVLEQSLPSANTDRFDGPDFRAVLVPYDSLQHHMVSIARHLGIAVISIREDDRWPFDHEYRFQWQPGLPRLTSEYDLRAWPPWFPAKRCKLPDYVPDVVGGASAPVKLTEWKIKAIKLLIVLERRGFVTRADMKALQLDPTIWCTGVRPYLKTTARGFERWDYTPDLKKQHPKNWAEIEADFKLWSAGLPQALPL